MDSIETIIIGAGVIGLAIARQLALQGHDVLILEATSTIGSVTTARNSCVIHAGIYYAPTSAKAPHCIAGRDALYQYLAERQLPHQRCGKLIVATNPEQIAKLQEIEQRAIANGVHDLQWLDTEGVHAKEPAVRGVAGLFSPSTGIVDVHELIHSFLGDAENHGVMLALHCPVTAVQVQEHGFLVNTGGDHPATLSCRNLINAAGLGAQIIAHHIAGLPSSSIPLRTLAKGNYFSLQGVQPFSHLVYPVPEIGGLGIHATIDLAGKVRFGPDVEWVETEDYTVNPARAESFYAAIRRYWPDLPDGALQPDYCGIRPKTNLPNHGDTDFIIQSQQQHGIPRLINLYGIESPGLTASLSLAASVAGLLHD
jgi:L-2-hydroxyglutarate oxidase LhgO